MKKLTVVSLASLIALSYGYQAEAQDEVFKFSFAEKAHDKTKKLEGSETIRFDGLGDIKQTEKHGVFTAKADWVLIEYGDASKLSPEKRHKHKIKEDDLFFFIASVDCANVKSSKKKLSETDKADTFTLRAADDNGKLALYQGYSVIDDTTHNRDGVSVSTDKTDSGSVSARAKKGVKKLSMKARFKDNHGGYHAVITPGSVELNFKLETFCKDKGHDIVLEGGYTASRKVEKWSKWHDFSNGRIR